MTSEPGQSLSESLECARREIAEGRFAAADCRLQGILVAHPGHPQARKLLIQMVGRLGLEINDPNLASYGPAPDPDRPRFLLIKAWGYGFWSDMNHVLAGLLVAEITGRIPVVHWGRNSLFYDGEGESFRHYWQPVSNYTIEDVARAAAKGGVYPAKWTADNLDLEDLEKWRGENSKLGAPHFFNQPQAVAVSDYHAGVLDVAPWIPPRHPLHGQPLERIYQHLAARYLTPHPAVVEAVDRFAAEHFAGHDVMAVHMRGSDKVLEDPTLPTINRQYMAYLLAEPASTRFFIMSDDQGVIESFKASPIGGRIVFTDSQRSASGLGVHYGPENDKVAMGREILVDSYLALRCNRFMGYAWSNVSDMIRVLKDWGPDGARLFGPSMLLTRQLGLYLDA